MKKNNNKGFTLMEMLIVVAIIAILIAIAIPTFSKTLERSREATDGANIRAAYADAMAEMLTTNSEKSVDTVKMVQATAGWVNTEIANATLGEKPTTGTQTTIGSVEVVKDDVVTVKVTTEGIVTLTKKAASK